MTSVSVLVITHRRDDHLLHQQRALQRVPGWDEAVVTFINQPDVPWAAAPPRVRVEHLTADGLALAQARNHAARAGRGEVLVFLDVDCLPGPGTIARLADECQPGRVVMAEPRYLPPSWTPNTSPESVALPHHSRAGLPVGRTDAWHMFWSLGFAMRADDFASVGGFDEGYSGYGGEDTDFAFACRRAGMELWLSSAPVFHQAHAVHRPPLQHTSSIVINARRFRERWGTWPMEGWLAALASRGLVAWGDDDLELLREPTAQELADSLVPDARF